MKNLTKAQRQYWKPPRPGTKAHENWRHNVREGVRRAQEQRQAAGLWTAREIEKKHFLPRGSVKRMVEDGSIQGLSSGRQAFIPDSEYRRVFRPLAHDPSVG